jgi:uncharacterized membrane protein
VLVFLTVKKIPEKIREEDLFWLMLSVLCHLALWQNIMMGNMWRSKETHLMANRRQREEGRKSLVTS